MAKEKNVSEALIFQRKEKTGRKEGLFPPRGGERVNEKARPARVQLVGKVIFPPPVFLRKDTTGAISRERMSK